MNTIVYTTSTEQAALQRRIRRQHASVVTAMHNVANASVPPSPKVGRCIACGSVEVMLDDATSTVDLSAIGESATYPTGYGCEVCS